MPSKSIPTKTCFRCRRDRPQSEFCKMSASKDGLGYYCRRCRSEMRGAKSRRDGYKRGSLRERLLANLTPEPMSGCLLWTGRTENQGYGSIRKSPTCLMLAHRAAWEILAGPIPDGLHVLHKCHTPACCNPDHLYLGTHADNMRDMARENRRKKREGLK